MNTGIMTGIDRKILEDEIAQRRKPRMYASINTEPSPATPYHIDFCIWLQSEALAKERIEHIVCCGGRWLGGNVIN